MLDTPRGTDHLAADWTVVVLLVVFGCLTYATMAAPRKLGVLQRSFFALRLGKQAQRDELDPRDRTLVVLLLGSVLLLGLFTYQALVFAGSLPPGGGSFVEALGIALVLLLLPLLLLQVLAWVTNAGEVIMEYGRTVLLFHIMLGALLLPLTMLMAFPPEPDWRPWIWGVGAVAIVAALLYRLLRATVIGLGEGVPLRYILIYLCAAEVVPVALVLQQVRHLFPELPHQL